MTTELIVGFEVDGYHAWKDAPEQYVEFRNKHRHLFKIICHIPMEDSSDPGRRQIELWEARYSLLGWIDDQFGNPAEFGNMSVEGIADYIRSRAKYVMSRVFVGEEYWLGAVSSE